MEVLVGYGWVLRTGDTLPASATDRACRVAAGLLRPVWLLYDRPTPASGHITLDFGHARSTRRDTQVSAAPSKTPVEGQVRHQVGSAAVAVQPELRATNWEVGISRRAETVVFGVFAELSTLVHEVIVLSWWADRLRTLVALVALVALATVAGSMSTFGLLSTQRLLVQWFSDGPTPDRVKAALEGQGSHAELIATGGRFATPYALQAAGYQSRESSRQQAAGNGGEPV
ncbi:hypothetical protein Ari01nite_86020 [Paractinoplanes rishiriensis]|uniref:Uncharacterized protein n=2 Tax=Paractinoplanes rishiriensis TaxID=1050105 RepID=A0A919N2P0_9ACTN|nr:hypothetical protein Ari01nite_86020 [Actinoplanes rishiriensis]